jgi:ferredoxin
VQVCPTAALEYDLMPMLGSLMDQGVRANDATVPVPAVMTCSKVPGDLVEGAAQVSCLGKISPAMILASQAWGQELRLVRSDCATCKLGGPSVPESLENVLEIAQAYRKNIGSEPLNVSIFQYQPDEARRPHPVAPPVRTVSRRQAFSQMFQTSKRNAAQVIPEEWKWRRVALKSRPVDDTPQYWPVPTINDQCTFCTVCESICPSQAVTRTRDGAGNYAIKLEVAACVMPVSNPAHHRR